MKISIFNDYSIFDAGKQRNIDEILQRLTNVNEKEVSLDFTNCLIDYPATSKLIDKILFDLSKLSGDKRLTILSDLTVNNESLILSLLIWGSSFFDFSRIKRSSPPEDYKVIINSGLIKNLIKVEINLLKDDNSLFKQFSYG